jgi:peptidoglycan glycosyltransferase
LASHRTPEQRRRLSRRAAPLVAGTALAAFAAGLLLGGGDSGAERTAAKFASAWERGDYASMHGLLTAEARARVSSEALEAAYESAHATATATALTAGDSREGDDGLVAVPVAVRTRVFGTVSGEVRLRVEGEAIDWQPHLAFPGLGEGELLERRMVVPERAGIVSADGEVLAEGPAGSRSSPIGEVASSIAGAMAPSDDQDEQAALYRLGFDRDTPVGTSGLERILERRLAGRPGGELLAGARVLARGTPRAAPAVRTTIDTRVQAAASAALAGRFGGVAALDPRTGAVLALAGVAFSASQPPGSTFKIVTATAALEAKAVKPSDVFPVETRAVIDGVELENANGESCGGDFANSFAHSCNSVFAPLGVKVGSERLVDTSERYGWNEDLGIPGAAISTIPTAAEIASPLEQASTAIGQFRSLATPLLMASVAQTIANDGVRLRPTLTPPPTAEAGLGQTSGEGIRVTSPRIAATIERMMVGVVDYGTGTLAHVDGVKVAGKTGTAELEDTRGDDPEAEERHGDPSNTTAWFTSYAPAGKPRIAVAVMLVRNGAGGATAAPAAQGVLVAGLKALR